MRWLARIAPHALQACLLVVLLPAAGMAQDDLLWRKVEPENLVLMEIGEGTVVFELNPLFAPETVKRFRELVAEDFYRGLSFYRVIDGFVAQGGDESDIAETGEGESLPPEFEIEVPEDLPWTSVQEGDLFAAETGLINGFAAGRDKGQVWLTHCPGVVAMARSTDPGSGKTDFYIVIGQAPRYLDRNLTIFGRVIHGMDVVQRIQRGPTDANGIIDNDLDRSRIKRMQLGTEIPEAEAFVYYVMDTASKGFIDLLKARRNRSDDWFYFKPPKVLDVCQVPVATRQEKPVSVLRRILPKD